MTNTNWQKIAEWLAEKLEDKDCFCCQCSGFKPDYSTPESVGDCCIYEYSDCGFGWLALAEETINEGE